MSEDSRKKALLSPYSYAVACDVCAHLHGNLAIEFQMRCDQMTREEAKRNADQRMALIIVRHMLCDAGEQLLRKESK